MDDGQFREFLQIVAGRQADHDLLIEIKTIVNLNHQTYENEKIETSKKIVVVERTVSAAHKRLDYLFGSVLLALAGLIISVVTFFIVHKPGGPS